MDAPRQYAEELKSELGLYPTWMPTDPIELGVFGTFVRGVFRKEGRLADLGIDFVTKAHASKNSFAKHRGMTFEAKSRAAVETALVDLSLGVQLSATRAYAWAFAAVGARLMEIEDILQVGAAVLEARRTGLWRGEWLLVTEVQHADVLNVVVAKSRDVKGNVTAKGRVGTAGEVLLSEDVSYHFDTADTFIVENAKNVTPLFGLRKLRGIFNEGLRAIAGGEAPAAALTLERTDDAPMFPI